MKLSQPITPCLWFDNQGEDAAKFYVSVFANSHLGAISRYSEAGQEHHKQKPGTAMTVSFTLDGQPFTALNGGPVFKLNEAVSFQLMCESQDEVDYYWNKLSEGGDPKSQQCGWLKDRFGVSWQVVPTILPKLMTDPDAGRAARATNAMMQMKKLDIAALKRAAEG